MNGGGWMLLLEQANQEALLQEFKGLCGSLRITSEREAGITPENFFKHFQCC
ncbi:hypothetical protein PAMP_009565 [Pampus punctatissimus]